MNWKRDKRESMAVKGRLNLSGDRQAPKETRVKKSRDFRESRLFEKAKIREEKLKKLMEMRAPERQVLKPRPGDSLSVLPLYRFVLAVGCITIFVSGLFVLNYLAQSKNQLGAEVSRLTTEQQRLKENNGHLKAKLERLLVLENLETIARDPLGLAMPRTGQIVVLE
jgi:cell division protein FtsB